MFLAKLIFEPFSIIRHFPSFARYFSFLSSILSTTLSRTVKYVLVVAITNIHFSAAR